MPDPINRWEHKFDPAYHWRWAINGLGGVIGLFEAYDRDASLPPMSLEQANALEAQLLKTQ